MSSLVVVPAAHAQRVAPTLDGIIVKVDNRIVLKSDLEGLIAQAVANGQPANEQLRCRMLQNIVVQKLLLARADADSVVVDDKQVQGELDRRMAYFAGQLGSEQKLEEYYNKTIKQLKDELRTQVRDQLVAQKMQEQITGKVEVTPRDVRKYYNQIPKDSLPYYSTEVEVGQIVKLAAPGAAQKQNAIAKLRELKTRIQAGEDFGTLAKQFSEDPGSASTNGELGFFKKKELTPEYEAASIRLEPGQMSDIVESPFGFHLIQLIERRGDTYNTRHILLKASSSEGDLAETAKQLAAIRRRITHDSLTFAKAAKDFSDDRETKTSGGLLMDARTSSSFIALDKIDPAVFFTIDTMAIGHITPPLPYRTDDGKDALRILYLKAKRPPHQANLKDDYQKLAAAAMSQRKALALDAWFELNKGSVFIEVDPEYSTCKLLDLEQ
ncbi:MAG: peptidylprolyl isomerase [Hymenobacteraceae bacterium]|nr:peptidylprolyl isomerase [Hymenobacteraceae bacterium]